jgi:hypothetical protein
MLRRFRASILAVFLSKSPPEVYIVNLRDRENVVAQGKGFSE